MKTARQCLGTSGFDFDAFETQNEYSAKNILNAMKEYANQSKWISVETEKPEARKDVPHLSINVIGRDVVNSMECFFNYYRKRWYDANGNNVIIIEWQPFPEKP